MDTNGVRRRDTTKGPPLRILSLDGGGVRGYSMLIIIQELMHRTFVETEGRAPRRHEIPKPCDHFDLILGTGTGGLIALMLGRLRLDLETCKELYVQLTRMVFETDKTIAGIPYRSTLFKASKLEEAIKEAVRAHTASEAEGNDGSEVDLASPFQFSRRLSFGSTSGSSQPKRHSSNASTLSFSARSPSTQARPMLHHGRGDANARLYDARENATKTAVTAEYKGSPRNAAPCILRSYDSRHEPPPEFECKIWQAGRATCAIGLAFKPITIGHSIFHDDGNGTFNPAPEALQEAAVNEWPGREIGVFVSVGTGRRPKTSDSNSQVWYEGFLGEFAEARKRLIAKIEGCEKIHEMMMRDYLPKRGVNVDNYFRLNVEVGVGEFGMNEWNRLGDISTSTRRYMARPTEQKLIQGISTRLAKILRAKARWERAGATADTYAPVPEIVKTTSATNFETPQAVELPGDSPTIPIALQNNRLSTSSWESGLETLSHNNPLHPTPPRTSLDPGNRPGGARPPRPERADHSDDFLVANLTPSQYRYASGDDKISITSSDEMPHPHELPRPRNAPPPSRLEPPPLPPKTPLPENQRGSGAVAGLEVASADDGGNKRRFSNPAPPYPVDDAGPPAVNMSRKPGYPIK